MFGVSPAYFLSRFGEAFTDRDVIQAAPDLAKTGFSSFQLEVFSDAQLRWFTRARLRELIDTVHRSELTVRTFVAHLVGESFATAKSIASDDGFGLLETLLDALPADGTVSTCVVPALPLCSSTGAHEWHGTERALARRIARLAEICGARGFRLALEVVPGSAITGTGHLSALYDAAGVPESGLCLDTGHVHCTGEHVEALVGRFQGRILALHLSDNDGCVNTSDPPGSGRFDWRTFADTLRSTACDASIDLEIRCPGASVDEAYDSGLQYIRSIWGEQDGR